MGFVEDETPWCGGHVRARAWCVRANNPSPMTYVGTNSWIVAEPGAKECVVIDPAPAGEQVQRILATCGETGLRIGAIVATHDHPDHIEGIPELVAATGAPVYAPRTSRIEQLLQKHGFVKCGGSVHARRVPRAQVRSKLGLQANWIRGACLVLARKKLAGALMSKLFRRAHSTPLKERRSLR